MSLRSLFILSALCVSCSRGPVDLAYLEAYIRDTDNGLVRSRSANGITASVMLVPPLVCALRSQASGPDTTHDPLHGFGRQLSVMLKLAPDTAHYNGDVMTIDVHTMERFIQRAFLLNFDWERMVELRCGGKVYHPVLSTLENTYGLTKDRNVMLVFAPGSADDSAFYHSDTLELIVRDDLLGTGTQHFLFDREALDRVPTRTV